MIRDRLITSIAISALLACSSMSLTGCEGSKSAPSAAEAPQSNPKVFVSGSEVKEARPVWTQLSDAARSPDSQLEYVKTGTRTLVQVQNSTATLATANGQTSTTSVLQDPTGTTGVYTLLTQPYQTAAALAPAPMQLSTNNTQTMAPIASTNKTATLVTTGTAQTAAPLNNQSQTTAALATNQNLAASTQTANTNFFTAPTAHLASTTNTTNNDAVVAPNSTLAVTAQVPSNNFVAAPNSTLAVTAQAPSNNSVAAPNSTLAVTAQAPSNNFIAAAPSSTFAVTAQAPSNNFVAAPTANFVATAVAPAPSTRVASTADTENTFVAQNDAPTLRAVPNFNLAQNGNVNLAANANTQQPTTRSVTPSSEGTNSAPATTNQTFSKTPPDPVNETPPANKPPVNTANSPLVLAPGTVNLQPANNTGTGGNGSTAPAPTGKTGGDSGSGGDGRTGTTAKQPDPKPEDKPADTKPQPSGGDGGTGGTSGDANPPAKGDVAGAGGNGGDGELPQFRVATAPSFEVGSIGPLDHLMEIDTYQDPYVNATVTVAEASDPCGPKPVDVSGRLEGKSGNSFDKDLTGSWVTIIDYDKSIFIDAEVQAGNTFSFHWTPNSTATFNWKFFLSPPRDPQIKVNPMFPPGTARECITGDGNCFPQEAFCVKDPCGKEEMKLMTVKKLGNSGGEILDTVTSARTDVLVVPDGDSTTTTASGGGHLIRDSLLINKDFIGQDFARDALLAKCPVKLMNH